MLSAVFEGGSNPKGMDIYTLDFKVLRFGRSFKISLLYVVNLCYSVKVRISTEI